MFKKRNLNFFTEKDERIKVMMERINMTEKNLEDFCLVFGGLTRKLARYRDKNDEMAKKFITYSDAEKINKSLSIGMKSFAKALTILADFIDIEVHRIEFKIVSELTKYESICINTRENLRASVNLRCKEIARQNQLIDMKSKFALNSSAGDSELLKAKLDVNKSNKQIDEIIDNFEKQKIHDIKNIMLDFILIQIKQHTKAIEILSAGYYDISNVNEKQDFQDFKKLLKVKDKMKKSFLKNEYRSQSLENLQNPKLLKTSSISTRDLSSSISDYEEDEDEDEDETNDESVQDKSDSSDNEESDKSLFENDFTKQNDETNSQKSVYQVTPKLPIKEKLTNFTVKNLDNPTKPLTTHSTILNTNHLLTSVKSINGVTKYQATPSPLNYNVKRKLKLPNKILG